MNESFLFPALHSILVACTFTFMPNVWKIFVDIFHKSMTQRETEPEKCAIIENNHENGKLPHTQPDDMNIQRKCDMHMCVYSQFKMKIFSNGYN